jgi:hypothetical protein
MQPSSPLVAALTVAMGSFVLGVAISFVLVRAGKIARIQWQAGIVASLAVGAFIFAARWGKW